jgi:membrane protease YdiL (CAAX protease family)
VGPEISPTRLPRTLEAALCATGIVWALAAGIAATHAASGFALRLQAEQLTPLLRAVFFVFLLLAGFTTISWIALREGSVRVVNALPQRATAAAEWRLGAGLGWALALAVVAILWLTRCLSVGVWWQWSGVWGMLLALLTAAVGTLGVELLLRGFVFRHLLRATGPVTATVLVACFCGLQAMLAGGSPSRSAVVAFVFSVLYSLAYLRTRALWLGWGIRFAWTACIAVLFGLPLPDTAAFASLTEGATAGAAWWTGGADGPAGSLLTLVLLGAACVALYRLTRDLAWEYTHEPIVAAGYPMEIAPPKAHTDMEATAAAKPTLVQILSSTPAAASTLPEAEKLLRGEPRE